MLKKGCGHCKAMKPAYGEVAEVLKRENLNGFMAAVDATKEKKIADKYDLKGFPTLKYFQKGAYMWDLNERTKEGLLAFMKEYLAYLNCDYVIYKSISFSFYILSRKTLLIIKISG